MRKNSIKNTRINMEVQRELSEIIRTGDQGPAGKRRHDLLLWPVEVTPDLKYCKAYISVLGDEERAKDGDYRPEKRRGLHPPRACPPREPAAIPPEISFVLDQSIEHGVNMSRLIDEVTRDLKD